MKRILLSLLLSTAISLSNAQTNGDTSQHLSFKGVPINGTLEEYVTEMKKSGFTHLDTDDGTAMLEGDFAGYKNCLVVVSTLKQKDLVDKIVVLFPKKDTWSGLSGNYFNLKQMLTEKYGDPTDAVEKFDKSFEPKDDRSKFFEVKLDRCKYYSKWETDKGKIGLMITHDTWDNCYVSLSYFDKINGEQIRKQALDDL